MFTVKIGKAGNGFESEFASWIMNG